MVAAHQPLPVTGQAPQERGDAARNRRLLLDAARDPQTRHRPPLTLHRAHIRMLLESARSTGDLDAQADALLALLDADCVAYYREVLGQSLDELGKAWDSVARKLCGQ
ncbi:MAG: hypothetical protein WAM92_15975 [Mycobacterium sp.]